MQIRIATVMPRMLSAVVLMAGLSIVVFGLAQWWYVRDSVNDVARLRTLLDRGNVEAFLSAKLDLYNRRADDTKTLLAYLLVIGGFITALQGMFAYFNVQSFVKQADETLRRLTEQGQESTRKQEAQASETITRLEREATEAILKLESIRSSAESTEAKSQERLRSIEENLPVFTQMDRVIKEAMRELQRFFNDPDMLTDSYEVLTPAERQRIIYYEWSVAGMEFTELPSLRLDLSHIYRGLSVFYASKYFTDVSALETHQQQSGGNSTCDAGCPLLQHVREKTDLARARMYAEMARAKTDNAFCIENDLAWMALKEHAYALAEEHCRRSLACRPLQQRAFSNLGISLFFEKKFDQAIPVLRQAMESDIWESHRKDRKSLLHYNLACALVRLAEGEEGRRASLLQEAFNELQQTLAYSTTGLKKHFDDDTKQGGDLYLLASSGMFDEGLLAIRASLN